MLSGSWAELDDRSPLLKQRSTMPICISTSWFLYKKKVFQPSRHFCSPKYPDPSIFSYFDQKTPLLCRFIRPSIVGSDTPWANTTPPHPKPRCWEIGAWAHVPLAKAPNFPLLWPRVPWTSLSPAPTDQRNLEVSKRKKSHGGLTKKIEQMRV